MKIVSYEKADFKDDEVIIDEVTITYHQNNDCTGEDEDGNEGMQSLTLTARNNGVDRFVNISTKSWSINSVDELTVIIEDFQKRAKFEDDDLLDFHRYIPQNERGVNKDSLLCVDAPDKNDKGKADREC